MTELGSCDEESLWDLWLFGTGDWRIGLRLLRCKGVILAESFDGLALLLSCDRQGLAPTEPARGVKH